MAIRIGNGAKFKFGSTPTVVGEVISISGPNFERSSVDTTNLATTTARTFVAGMFDPGEITLELNFDNNDAGQVLVEAAVATGAENNWEIEFAATTAEGADPLTFSGTCIVQSFSNNIAMDEAETASVTLKVVKAISTDADAS
mgnify:FL=1|tara:strand:- start:460 stop:888 length:429 start_codon:yes stop_codon:yes gene_type:complete